MLFNYKYRERHKQNFIMLNYYCDDTVEYSNTHCPPVVTEKREYLWGLVRVASREAGHDPDVASPYQAQRPSFLQDVPVEE